MSFLDALIYGIRDAYAAGVLLAKRNKINFSTGLTATDDPVNGWTNVVAAAATTPTGDGWRHVTAGVEDAAAALVDLANPAHVDAATVLPVANGGTALNAIGAALEVLRVNAYGTALEYAANSPTMPGATANEVITTDGAGAPQATSNVRAVADAIEIGAAPVASAGGIRFPTTTNLLAVRDVADAADLVAMAGDATDKLYIGSDAAFANAWADVYLNAVSGLYLATGGTVGLVVTATDVKATGPITGNSSAYGVHGNAVIDMVDADYTAVADEYQMGTITNGSATPQTAARTLTMPAAATEALAYAKFYRNANGGTFDLVVSDGVGSTVTIADGFGAWVLMTPAGAVRMTPDT